MLGAPGDDAADLGDFEAALSRWPAELSPFLHWCGGRPVSQCLVTMDSMLRSPPGGSGEFRSDFIAVCGHVPVVDGAAAPVAPPPARVLPEKSLGLARRTICSGAANVWWRMWKKRRHGKSATLYLFLSPMSQPTTARKLS